MTRMVDSDHESHPAVVLDRGRAWFSIDAIEVNAHGQWEECEWRKPKPGLVLAATVVDG